MIQRGNGRSKSHGTTASRLPIEREVPSAVADKPDWCARAESWIARHPLLSIATAVTLGATLGWLIKRR